MATAPPKPKPKSNQTPTPNSIALTRHYGPHPLNAVTLGLAHQNQLHLASSADHDFSLGHYGDCAALCRRILAARAPPAEAIQARAHMYLAMAGVGPEERAQRLRHAEAAVRCWDVVIARTGSSRFPVERARVERGVAVGLVEEAGGGDLGKEDKLVEDGGMGEGTGCFRTS